MLSATAIALFSVQDVFYEKTRQTHDAASRISSSAWSNNSAIFLGSPPFQQYQCGFEYPFREQIIIFHKVQ